MLENSISASFCCWCWVPSFSARRARAPRERAPWYDLVLLLASVVVGGYLAVYYPSIVNEIGELTAEKIALGALAMFLVAEACRRMSGWWLILFAAVFVLYARFSFLFPGILYARGITWSKMAVHLYIDPNSLLGTLSIVATTVIAYFSARCCTPPAAASSTPTFR
jgi:TRAP-type uncharacterized transport system fused permease subunit